MIRMETIAIEKLAYAGTISVSSMWKAYYTSIISTVM